MQNMIYEFSDYRSLEKLIAQMPRPRQNIFLKNTANSASYLSINYFAKALSYIQEAYPSLEYKFILDTNGEIQNFFEGLNQNWHYFLFQTEQKQIYQKLNLIAKARKVRLLASLNEIM